MQYFPDSSDIMAGSQQVLFENMVEIFTYIIETTQGKIEGEPDSTLIFSSSPNQALPSEGTNTACPDSYFSLRSEGKTHLAIPGQWRKGKMDCDFNDVSVAVVLSDVFFHNFGLRIVRKLSGICIRSCVVILAVASHMVLLVKATR